MCSNGYEIAARERKALAIADFLQFRVGIQSASVARNFNSEQWGLAATGAGVASGKASEQTRARVVAILASRERISAAGFTLDGNTAPVITSPAVEQLEIRGGEKRLRWLGGGR